MEGKIDAEGTPGGELEPSAVTPASMVFSLAKDRRGTPNEADWQVLVGVHCEQ